MSPKGGFGSIGPSGETKRLQPLSASVPVSRPGVLADNESGYRAELLFDDAVLRRRRLQAASAEKLQNRIIHGSKLDISPLTADHVSEKEEPSEAAQIVE